MPAFANRLNRFADRSRQWKPSRLQGNQGDTNDSGLHHEKRSSHSQLHRPGDAVLESGIYEVVHDLQHRSSHEVVMISGDHFPTCDTCTERVRFRLIRTAPYIFSDEDFEEEQN